MAHTAVAAHSPSTVQRALSIIALVAQASCYRLPIWKGDVDVSARARGGIKQCGTGALTGDGVTAISRPPYLQATTTTSTTVAWGSLDGGGELVLSEPDGGAVVATIKGTYAGAPEKQAARLARLHQLGTTGTAEDIYVMASQATGLTPTHLYCYQLVADGHPLTVLAPLTTAAAPHPPEPIHFIAIGDSGTGGAAAHAIMKRVSAEPFDLMLFLGDIAYPDGTAAQLEANFFEVYRDFLRYVPAYPTLGNHERHTQKGAPYLEAFVLPAPERYYSWDWGDVHFVAIDTTQRDAAQLAWLDQDLTNTKQPWTIVFGHHPMYTNSLRGPQLKIRRAFAKILTDHQVDLVVTGHEHHYERFRIANVNYVVSGGGGGQLTRILGRSKSLAKAAVHHFLAFEVSATQLQMRAIDINGKEIERLELSKDDAGATKLEINDKPSTRQNQIPPEPNAVSDEKVHDEPDDDHGRREATPEPPAPLPGR